MFLTKKPLKKILTKYSIFFLSILKKVYPTLPLNMKRVGLFCLASLVWHRDWLRQNLHARHPLFYSTLFSTNLIDDLGPFVACRLHRSGDKLTVTGIPVHTSILIHVKDMTQRMENIPEALQAVTTNVTQSVVYELETRALQSQSVTPEALQTLFHSLEANIEQRLNRFAEASTTVPTTATSNPNSFDVFTWGGTLNALPVGFSLPKGGPAVAFSYWLLGSPRDRITPLSRVKSSDFSHQNSRKRFSDFKYLMARMESIVHELGHDLPTSASPTTSRLIAEVEQKLVGELARPRSLKRSSRPFDQSWQTATKLLRSNNRERNED